MLLAAGSTSLLYLWQDIRTPSQQALDAKPTSQAGLDVKTASQQELSVKPPSQEALPAQSSLQQTADGQHLQQPSGEIQRSNETALVSDISLDLSLPSAPAAAQREYDNQTADIDMDARTPPLRSPSPV